MSTEPTRRCPHCRERIPAAATRCRFCRKNVPPDNDEETAPGRPSTAIRASPPRGNRRSDEEHADDFVERRPRRRPRDRDEDYEDKPRRRRPQPGPYADCPQCGCPGHADRVTFTWWGGLVGPAMFNHVRCRRCDTCYNGKTGNY